MTMVLGAVVQQMFRVANEVGRNPEKFPFVLFSRCS